MLRAYCRLWPFVAIFRNFSVKSIHCKLGDLSEIPLAIIMKPMKQLLIKLFLYLELSPCFGP